MWKVIQVFLKLTLYFKTSDDKIIAVDAKVTIDDKDRRPNYALMRDERREPY